MTRENFLELMCLVRSFIDKENNVLEWLEGYSSDSESDELDSNGVSNGFLSQIAYLVTGYEIEITGEVEELCSCPCCSFKTLTESYNKLEGTGYDICPYCKWQDDGTTDINTYRSINKGSIADYRRNLCSDFNKYYINKWLTTKT
ncbi:CPCC family cysteine-rich protein [Saccharibacillus sacchari]|uniref:CPCC family cysteine-rich protein n=1 Tax=Saccharibacillus sacchari TaxID=456493 RepID=A0ACC6PKL0_9BACL